MFGYKSIKEVLNLNPLEFISEKDKETAEEDYQDRGALNETLKFIYEGRTKNSELLIIEKGITKFTSSNKTEYIIESYLDITEQQKAKRALEESEERYRSITENIDDAIWTMEYVNKKLVKSFISPSIFEITKYADKEFEKNPKLWLRIIHPDDKLSVISKLRRVLKDRVRNQVELEYRILDKQGSLVWVRNKLNFIRDDFGAIEKTFGLFSDITLNKRNAEKLQKTTNELQTSNESKDRFISIISHDLRTPFSSILGFTDILLTDDDISEDKQKQYIGFIQESAQNMLKLVNSILDWTRLQTGRIDYVAERLNIQTVVSNAIQMLTGSALQKNVKLYSTIDHEVFVHGDRNLLLQVFNNLISNAIKFTNSDGEIFISAEPLMDKKVIQFSVNDTGVGISDRDIDKLFSVDDKYTTDGTKGEKGSGLGLSLVKEIILKHGGEISVESEVGTGTSFIFTIPVSSTKILLIDDVQSDVILYKKLLNNIMPDYQVEVAYDGDEGFEAIQKMAPALVITDHIMPKMSGFELVKKIMNSDELKYKPPVIVLSSDATNSIAKEYEELGVEYTFKKPVGLTVFKNAIEKSLQKALIS
jgi:PAS domain S-box-containing protein